jgi:hypothetical protein
MREKGIGEGSYEAESIAFSASLLEVKTSAGFTQFQRDLSPVFPAVL